MLKLLTDPGPGQPASRPAPPGREQCVAEVAYGLSQRRGFAPGREMEDWLLAESQFMDAQAGASFKG